MTTLYCLINSQHILCVEKLSYLSKNVQINYSTPRGMEDPGAYPYLFAELMGHGWSAEELTKLAGQNLLRVMTEVKICILKLSLCEHRCML